MFAISGIALIELIVRIIQVMDVAVISLLLYIINLYAFTKHPCCRLF